MICENCQESDFEFRKAKFSEKSSEGYAHICQPCPNIIWKGSLDDIKNILGYDLFVNKDREKYHQEINSKRSKKVTVEFVGRSKYCCPTCQKNDNLFQRYFVEDWEKYEKRELDSCDFTILTTCKNCETHSFEYYLANNIFDLEVVSLPSSAQFITRDFFG